MIEREPSFEDERIRTWTSGAEHEEPEAFEEDPTVMRLDVEREEIFESRIYCFRPDRDVLLYLMDQATVSLSEQSPSPDEIVQLAMELMEDTTFKFLAKRNKQDGLVSSLLVAAGGGERFLLLRQEGVKEDEYREAVHDFETGFLLEGVLADPGVTSWEEWQRYAKEESLPE